MKKNLKEHWFSLVLASFLLAAVWDEAWGNLPSILSQFNSCLWYVFTQSVFHILPFLNFSHTRLLISWYKFISISLYNWSDWFEIDTLTRVQKIFSIFTFSWTFMDRKCKGPLYSWLVPPAEKNITLMVTVDSSPLDSHTYKNWMKHPRSLSLASMLSFTYLQYCNAS